MIIIGKEIYYETQSTQNHYKSIKKSIPHANLKRNYYMA
jgi:hypothetical protein